MATITRPRSDDVTISLLPDEIRQKSGAADIEGAFLRLVEEAA
jgi:hypothetical protein